MSGVPVFVVSLASSPNRQRIAARLSELGVAFRMIEAVDGRMLTKKQIDDSYDEQAALTRLGRPMGRGEIGCALSHRIVYALMREERCSAAIVLEDDADVGEEFASVWRNISRIPDSIELLSFHAAHGFVRRRPAAWAGRLGLHRAASPLSLTVGYFLRLGAAERLGHASLVDSVADWPVDHGMVKHYLAIPMPVGHLPHHSTLAKERAAMQRLRSRPLPVRIARALLYMTFVPFFAGRSRYASLQNYIDREVGWRVLRHLPPFFIDVAKLSRVAGSAGM
jgi:glycosyl transferase family 25